MADPQVGLVLGAGGVVGSAFHAGVLAALAAFGKWDARRADIVVGTSAGSLTGAFLRAGFPPADLAARARGEELSSESAHVLGRMGPVPETPAFGFGRSTRESATPRALDWSSLRPWQVRPGAIMAAMLPPGSTPSDPIRRFVDPIYGGAWADSTLWICAVSLRTARRVVFGRAEAPPASIGQAVAGSCAIPGFFEPVPIGGDEYVDGGAHSPTNLDVLRREELDLVIVISPMSTAGRSLRLSPDVPFRRWCRNRLANEARTIQRSGTHVVTFQPNVADQKAMGLNAMDPKRRAAVVRQAFESTRRRLERADLRSKLAPIFD
ncbi:MAG: patatin-like phospholipase family protein [Deltaproteobacteria bacterium]|nr:patatin-like phospholipase family protein [Deltaproteobacteria bacterium]MBW2396450.1 patatin-like phospholipase family protein [Deltaproteobacteria bacterium]